MFFLSSSVSRYLVSRAPKVWWQEDKEAQGWGGRGASRGKLMVVKNICQPLSNAAPPPVFPSWQLSETKVARDQWLSPPGSRVYLWRIRHQPHEESPGAFRLNLLIVNSYYNLTTTCFKSEVEYCKFSCYWTYVIFVVFNLKNSRYLLSCCFEY